MKKFLGACLMAGGLLMIGVGCSPTAGVSVTPPASDAYRTITQETVIWDGKVYQFVHRCQGEVKANEQYSSVPFCVGMNQLAVIDPSFNVKVLKSDAVTTDADAPVLLGAKLIYPPYPSKPNGKVLLSYVQETCTTVGDCGAGMPTNYVSFAYDLNDSSLHPLANFPGSGQANWNPSGTKAVFYPNSCGGAGCETVPLTGYDLAGDTTKTVTSAKAAGSDGVELSLPDVEGNALPVWHGFFWKDDDNFEVTIVHPDGSKELVKGTF